MMWNPPWTLPLVMPLSLLDYNLSRLVWYFLQVALVIYCAELLWRMYAGPKRWRWAAWGIALLSSYTIHMLVFGQISVFILLGMVWFAYLVRQPVMPNQQTLSPRAADLLAGAAALLISIKPQTFYLFYPLLLVWVLAKRRYWVLVGLFGALLAALAVSMAFNPTLISQYIYAVVNYPPQNWATPTLGYWARRLFGEELFWLQFPSVLVGLGWAFWHWRRKASAWDWAQELPLLVLVSLVTTAYAWTHDQVILIPTSLLILAGVLSQTGRWRLSATAWTVVWVGFHLGTIPLHFGQSDEKFVWQAPLILALYLWGLREVRHLRKEVSRA
jgi:hypothetical protein